MSDQAGQSFGKIPAWSIIYFLNCVYFDIEPSLLIFETPSSAYLQNISWSNVFGKFFLIVLVNTYYLKYMKR